MPFAVDKIHLAFALEVCYNTTVPYLQGWYIGITAASQAVKAGSTPVPCSRKETPFVCRTKGVSFNSNKPLAGLSVGGFAFVQLILVGVVIRLLQFCDCSISDLVILHTGDMDMQVLEV